MRSGMRVLLMAALAACGGGGDGPTGGDGIASVTLNAPSLLMIPGRGDQLAATARDASGSPVAGAPAATWRTSNAGVATVSATGFVNAIAVGSAIVTATIGSRSASADISVVAAPTNVTVSMPGLSFSPFKVTLKQNGRVNYEFPSLEHNVIFDKVAGAPADIPGMVRNQTITRTFAQTGLFKYTCSLHNGMDGEVDVVP